MPERVVLAIFSISLFFNSALNSLNLLRNDIGDGAAAIIAAAEQNGKIKTLCGIKPDQTEANFSACLEPADAQLLAFDLKFSSPLKVLNKATTKSERRAQQLWRQFYQAGEQLSAGTSLVSIRLILTTLIPLFASLSIFQ